MKIVINTCYGGFHLSKTAQTLYREIKEISQDVNVDRDCGEDRSDPDLVYVVATLGKDSWGKWSELKIIEIPDGVQYTIIDGEGKESIHEVHRSWE